MTQLEEKQRELIQILTFELASIHQESKIEYSEGFVPKFNEILNEITQIENK